MSMGLPDQRISPMPLAERVRLGAVPKRGMCSTVPATRADNGLLSGDGKMWVGIRRSIFRTDRLQQGKPLEAPQIAYVLPEVRRLMLEGEYKKALDLSLAAAENRCIFTSLELRKSISIGILIHLVSFFRDTMLLAKVILVMPV
jgi:hypothetical protein